MYVLIAFVVNLDPGTVALNNGADPPSFGEAEDLNLGAHSSLDI
jgi:hypothetical protein